MKTKMFVLTMSLIGILSCYSQDKRSKNDRSRKNKPHEEIKVNKVYDEKGNLIKLDSTYTSYYSNVEGDTLNIDSIMQNFNLFFNKSFSTNRWNYFFDMDSNYYHNFFSDDFFEKQFFERDDKLLKMMQGMDSIKNEFFRMYIPK